MCYGFNDQFLFQSWITLCKLNICQTNSHLHRDKRMKEKIICFVFCSEQEKKGVCLSHNREKLIYKIFCHKPTTLPGGCLWILDTDDILAFQSQDCFFSFKAMTRRLDSKAWLFNNGSIHMLHKVCHWLTAPHQNHMRPRDVRGGCRVGEVKQSSLFVTCGVSQWMKMNEQQQ